MAFSVAQGSFGNASRTSIVLTIPAACTTNDEILFLIEQDGNGTAPSTPSGWAQLTGSPQSGGGGSRQSAYIYKVTSSDVPGTTTYTFTWTTADFSAGVYVAVRDVDTTTPQDVAASKVSSTTTSEVLPSITTVTDNALGVILQGEQSSGVTHTGPGSELVDIDGGSIYTYIQTPAGATGTKTVTLSGASGGGAFMAALRPTPPPIFFPQTDVHKPVRLARR